MPSPFPGMNPYLEGEMWQEFHHRLANQISIQLMPSLSPGYIALLARRYVSDRPILSIEIRDVAERRLVTIIEILSPANKRGKGARDYVQRRVELLQTRVHLLEIDLLRQGLRIQLAGEPPPAPYYVYLCRWGRRPWTQIWPIHLRKPLPTVPVSLLPPDPDVSLDLQAALETCFDLVGYERLLDYASPPPPPALSDEDAAWATQVARQT